jgi:hypothetical protein
MWKIKNELNISYDFIINFQHENSAEESPNRSHVFEQIKRISKLINHFHCIQ